MNINKINVNGVEYDIQDKNTLDYLNEQLNDIYKKDETDTKINEATQDKASIEYVDDTINNAIGDINTILDSINGEVI